MYNKLALKQKKDNLQSNSNFIFFHSSNYGQNCRSKEKKEKERENTRKP